MSYRIFYVLVLFNFISIENVKAQDSLNNNLSMNAKAVLLPIFAGTYFGYSFNAFVEKNIGYQNSISVGFKNSSMFEMAEFQKYDFTAFLLEYRYYFDKSETTNLRGFYIGSYVKYRDWNSLEILYDRSSSYGNAPSLKIKDNAIGLGVVLGLQNSFISKLNLIQNLFVGFGFMKPFSEEIINTGYKKNTLLNRHFDIRVGYLIGLNFIKGNLSGKSANYIYF